MRQFGQRAAHRFLGQARIRIHDVGNRQSGGERLQDERHGNARAAHTRASAQMLRVSDNPVLHAVKVLQAQNKSSNVGESVKRAKQILSNLEESELTPQGNVRPQTRQRGKLQIFPCRRRWICLGE